MLKRCVQDDSYVYVNLLRQYTQNKYHNSNIRLVLRRPRIYERNRSGLCGQVPQHSALLSFYVLFHFIAQKRSGDIRDTTYVGTARERVNIV